MSEQEADLPRIVGLETEYAWRYASKDPRETQVTNSTEVDFCITRPPQIPVSNPESTSTFLSNGGRYYLDTGDHWEYATPECASFSEAVTYELAGDEYVTQHLSHPDLSKFFRAQMLNKRVIDQCQEPKSAGAHENYLARGRLGEFITDSRATSVLIGHLITRTLFAGAGSVGYEGQFYKAQKLRDVKSDISIGTTSNKPIINTRDEPHLRHHSGMFRLHITCGDSNMSPWATWMKLGTTSIVLRMLEHDSFAQDIALHNPLVAANVVVTGEALDKPLLLVDGQKTTAVNIQEQIIEQAIWHEYNHGLPEEEQEVLLEWIDVIDDLKDDPDKCMDRVDWIRRKANIDSQPIKPGQTSEYVAKKWDLGYDMLLPKPGLGARLRKQGVFRMMPTEDEIQHTMGHPPSTTRAVLRVEAMQYFAKSRKFGQVNWGEVKIDGDPYPLDPYDTDVESLRAWLDEH